MSFVEPHQNHCQKNKESNYTIPITKWLKASTWQELLRDGGQLSIAAGSGAAVATDILTLWNNGLQTH
jgi:hypothetical protein